MLDEDSMCTRRYIEESEVRRVSDPLPEGGHRNRIFIGLAPTVAQRTALFRTGIFVMQASALIVDTR
ncbi:hypothetical protein B0G57_12635 [Trinickia symbiotica]|nr:hypothetical protein [Trinickia symbiotica]PPK41706.1 hypothetical protein B0G57_12635 [Trinickia symbiotica]